MLVPAGRIAEKENFKKQFIFTNLPAVFIFYYRVLLALSCFRFLRYFILLAGLPALAVSIIPEPADVPPTIQCTLYQGFQTVLHTHVAHR